MAKTNKTKVSLTLMQENMDWVRYLTENTGISMSLFIDSILTGIRVTMKGDVGEREATSIAFEQIAKGLKATGK